jgi:hypothetical protein
MVQLTTKLADYGREAMAQIGYSATDDEIIMIFRTI